MIYICATKFDVTRNLEKIEKILGFEVNETRP